MALASVDWSTKLLHVCFGFSLQKETLVVAHITLRGTAWASPQRQPPSACPHLPQRAAAPWSSVLPTGCSWVLPSTQADKFIIVASIPGDRQPHCKHGLGVPCSPASHALHGPAARPMQWANPSSLRFWELTACVTFCKMCILLIPSSQQNQLRKTFLCTRHQKQQHN